MAMVMRWIRGSPGEIPDGYMGSEPISWMANPGERSFIEGPHIGVEFGRGTRDDLMPRPDDRRLMNTMRRRYS